MSYYIVIKTTWQAFCQNYWNWWKNNDRDDILQKREQKFGSEAL